MLLDIVIDRHTIAHNQEVNPDAFINREIIAENFEQAREKFNVILQNYSFVSIDFETMSVKLK